VVTASNTTAHLAGELGQRSRLLIESRLVWRWGRDDEDSLWSPAVRIFRQPTPGDWATPLAAMRQDLDQLRPAGAARECPSGEGRCLPSRSREGVGAGARSPLDSWVV